MNARFRIRGNGYKLPRKGFHWAKSARSYSACNHETNAIVTRINRIEKWTEKDWIERDAVAVASIKNHIIKDARIVTNDTIRANLRIVTNGSECPIPDML